MGSKTFGSESHSLLCSTYLVQTRYRHGTYTAPTPYLCGACTVPTRCLPGTYQEPARPGRGPGRCRVSVMQIPIRHLSRAHRLPTRLSARHLSGACPAPTPSGNYLPAFTLFGSHPAGKAPVGNLRDGRKTSRNFTISGCRCRNLA